jgi:hypothetical protein
MSEEEGIYVLTAESNFPETDHQAMHNLATSVDCLAVLISDLLLGRIADADDLALALNLLDVAQGLAGAVEMYTTDRSDSEQD